jgi:succinyl-diaminopimelate desuccinylase
MLIRIFERHRQEGMVIESVVLQEGEPAVASVDAKLADVLAQSIADVTGKMPGFELCPGILETRFFTARGIPGYAYGPGVLEISHGPDEYVELSSLFHCTKVYAITALRMLLRK